MFTIHKHAIIMNRRCSLELYHREKAILQDALGALQETTGAVGQLAPFQDYKAEQQISTVLDIAVEDKAGTFLVEVKAADRVQAITHVKAQLDRLLHGKFRRFRPLLVTPYMTRQLAEECRRVDLPFIDTAGNAYLRTNGIFIYVIGHNKPQHYEREAYRANTQAGLKIVFSLLCYPSLIGKTYREIAKFAEVALGTVGPVLKDLHQRGFVRKTRIKDWKLQNAEKLFDEWVTRYPETLRPKLNPRRYRLDHETIRKADLNRFQACWGGEIAAEILTGHLRAECYTIYTRGLPQDILAALRMRLDAGGNAELLTAFWPQELDDPGKATAPAILVYADLTMTGETRNVETANILYEQVIKPALGTE